MTLEDTIADVRRAVDTLRTPGLGLPKPVVDMLEEKVNALAADAVGWRSRAVCTPDKLPPLLGMYSGDEEIPADMWERASRP